MDSIYSSDRFLEVAAGAIGRLSSFDINGRNPDVDTGTDPEDVWNYGGLQTFMVIPAPLYISSSAAADTTQLIVLDGIDDLGDKQQAVMTPNGQNQVIAPQENRIDTFMLTFAALVAGPPIGTIITQAVSGASMSVAGFDLTLNTIWGYMSGLPDLANGFTDPTLTMNPDPNVPTAVTPCSFWLRMNFMYNTSGVALTGDLYVAEGNTLAAGVPTTAALVHGKIDIGMEMMQNAIYSVPNKHRVFLMDGWASINNDKGYAQFGVYTRALGGVWHNHVFTAATNDGSSFVQMTRKLPAIVPARCDIKIMCYAVEADNSDVSAGFQIILDDMRPGK